MPETFLSAASRAVAARDRAGAGARALALLLALLALPAAALDDAERARWVQAMKQAPLGPFAAVRWFCADGTILPPREYACREHGGGRQAGLRDERAEALRASGIPLANVLSEVTAERALAEDGELLKALLLEQFLVAADDGWIFRRARFVRGALQAEDDMAAARRIITALARDPRAPGTRFTLLREAVRLLPRPFALEGFTRLRAEADRLAQADASFRELRNLIHARPAPELAKRVRRHARRSTDADLRRSYEALAAGLEASFAQAALTERLHASAVALGDPELQRLAGGDGRAPEAELARLADIQLRIRARIGAYPLTQRAAALELSLAAEDAAFALARRLAGEAASRSRRERLRLLGPLLDALGGAGLLTERERRSAREALAALDTPAVTLAQYRAALTTLGRVPGWAARRLAFFFEPTVRRFERVEPLAAAWIPDRLHASALLSYSELLEPLAADADRLAGIRHELFDAPAHAGLRVLNPGLARGTLLPLALARESPGAAPVVLAPQTTADLPPVAGILTESEGNALSHVQLLARNLGVPNVVVGRAHLGRLAAHAGAAVVLAASPGGIVRLARDGPQWDRHFPQAAGTPALIEVDPARLDLARRTPLPLEALQAADAGRIVGPKAANLAELARRYPGSVSPAIVIPFGAFRALLDQPAPGADMPMFAWLQARYRALATIRDEGARAEATRRLLATVRDWLSRVPFPPELLAELRAMTVSVFGADGSYGAYVRSDTNLEDLPGFTGAGLNRTVPNVVGFDALIAAIREVWASPFSERAWGWRQAAMRTPEHVYVSVLLHRTVPSEKSGVMVTADPASGDAETLFVTANEGAGGGVDGQSAESLRLSRDASRVELVSSATEPTRRETLSGGGLAERPASGTATLLRSAELHQLAEVARTLPERYPQLRDADGRPAPADVEFAFVRGRLYLLQIRPFLQSPRALRSRYLQSLDAAVDAGEARRVELDAPPADGLTVAAQ